MGSDGRLRSGPWWGTVYRHGRGPRWVKTTRVQVTGGRSVRPDLSRNIPFFQSNEVLSVSVQTWVYGRGVRDPGGSVGLNSSTDRTTLRTTLSDYVTSERPRGPVSTALRHYSTPVSPTLYVSQTSYTRKVPLSTSGIPCLPDFFPCLFLFREGSRNIFGLEKMCCRGQLLRLLIVNRCRNVKYFEQVCKRK